MPSWPIVRLEDLASCEKSAISKPYGSAIVKEDYVHVGVPVVRGVNLARGLFHDDDFVYIREELADSMPGARLQSGDLVFTHRGSVGQVSMVPRRPRYTRYAVSTSQVKARLDPAKAVPEFYYYWFRSPAGRHSILQGASTVGVPGLAQPVATIKALKVPVPPITVQRGIAATLGTLDDKIESNRRSIGVIQNLSRLTYVAWRAIHPNTRDTTFGDFAEVFGGATPKTTESRYWGGMNAWATPTDITALSSPYLFGTSRTVTEAGLASTSATLHPAGTILMTSRATIGCFALTQLPAATNQGFIAVRPRKPEHRWFLFEEMRARVPEMLDRANGSTFLELSRGSFKLMPIGVPDASAMAELDSNLAALHAKAAQLDREASRLANVRDTLLPELLSGRIRVPESVAAIDDAL